MTKIGSQYDDFILGPKKVVARVVNGIIHCAECWRSFGSADALPVGSPAWDVAVRTVAEHFLLSHVAPDEWPLETPNVSIGTASIRVGRTWEL